MAAADRSICRNCRHARAVTRPDGTARGKGDGRHFECRAEAPRPSSTGGPMSPTVWPVVLAGDGCGRFERPADALKAKATAKGGATAMDFASEDAKAKDGEGLVTRGGKAAVKAAGGLFGRKKGQG